MLDIKLEPIDVDYDKLLKLSRPERRRSKRVNYKDSDNSSQEDENYKEPIKKKERQKQLWNCKKCREVFPTSTQLRKHRVVHRRNNDDEEINYRFDEARNVFTCDSCDVETDTKGEMEKHVWIHEERFVCDTCKESFRKPMDYSSHVYQHDPSKGYVCPLCNYRNNVRRVIKLHIDSLHLGKFMYNCELCGKGFNETVTYREHRNVHEGIRPFQCIVCNKDFAFSSYLTAHQIRNHKVRIDGIVETNQCPICYKRLSRMSTLKIHLQRHENIKEKEVPKIKKFLCDICGKSFACKKEYTIHYRVHTGVKPYTCSYCVKSFIKRDYLIMHERIHSGEKPYSCEHCGKCFNQGAPLRLHIRTHTGERPYKCLRCNNGFISRGVLNLHLKRCEGNSD